MSQFCDVIWKRSDPFCPLKRLIDCQIFIRSFGQQTTNVLPFHLPLPRLFKCTAISKNYRGKASSSTSVSKNFREKSQPSPWPRGCDLVWSRPRSRSQKSCPRRPLHQVHPKTILRPLQDHPKTTLRQLKQIKQHQIIKPFPPIKQFQVISHIS